MARKMIAVLPPKELVLDTEFIPTTQKKQFVHRECLADTVAECAMTVKNWYIPHGQEKFIGEPRMWTVDRYYQTAKPTPIAVDEVSTKDEAETLLTRKKSILRDAGVRYFVTYPDLELHDAHAELMK